MREVEKVGEESRLGEEEEALEGAEARDEGLVADEELEEGAVGVGIGSVEECVQSMGFMIST